MADNVYSGTAAAYHREMRNRAMARVVDLPPLAESLRPILVETIARHHAAMLLSA